MNRLLLAATALACTVTALPAAAQFQKPEDAIRYRQSAMFLQNYHLGRIFAMANGRVPFDAKVVQDNAAVLEAVSRLPYVAFVDGSDKGNTRAKPEIWTERVKFDAAAQKTQDEVIKLSAAAKTGNLDQIKAAAGATGQACKACHDNYQKPPN
jgi:cytochrome c556